MSSVRSAYADVPKLPTRFSSLISPAYDDEIIVDGEIIRMPIPFTAVNGVLDINVTQSADVQTFVDNGDYPSDEPGLQGKLLGGGRLITSFGSNMTSYLRNLIDREETLGAPYAGPLVLHIQPVMTKVQVANPALAINGEGPFDTNRSFGFTTEAPVPTDYIAGGTNDKFFTAWIFKTPLTVRYETVASGFKYFTMTSQFAEE